MKVLYDTSSVTMYDIKDPLAKRQTPQGQAKIVYCSKIKPTDSGTSSKGRKGPSKKGVGVFICVCMAGFVKELKVFSASL